MLNQSWRDADALQNFLAPIKVSVDVAQNGLSPHQERQRRWRRRRFK